MLHLNKTYPSIGAKLYLHQRTGSYYVDLVKRPYTVIDIKSNKVTIQAAKCILDPNDNYYDSLPIEIKADPNGEILELHWAPKKACWQIDKFKTGYPEIAVFTESYEYYPYLD